VVALPNHLGDVTLAAVEPNNVKSEEWICEWSLGTAVGLSHHPTSSETSEV